jgi:hypothetical protein
MRKMKHLKMERSDKNTMVCLPHHCIQSIKPDPDWEKRTHIKTNFKDKYGRPQWFHVKHSYAEVLDMYYIVKKNVEGR